MSFSIPEYSGTFAKPVLFRFCLMTLYVKQSLCPWCQASPSAIFPPSIFDLISPFLGNPSRISSDTCACFICKTQATSAVDTFQPPLALHMLLKPWKCQIRVVMAIPPNVWWILRAIYNHLYQSPFVAHEPTIFCTSLGPAVPIDPTEPPSLRCSCRNLAGL